jgi:two-component system, OmpR family, response regulator
MDQRSTPKQPAAPLVLIVDDDPGVRDICARSLGAAGYRTATAASAEEAMQAMAAELPGLVILDLLMPGTDGFATMHTLRSEQRTARVPILVLTGLAYHVEAATRRLGASAFCTKPLDLKRLEAQVRRLCPLPAGPTTPRPEGPTSHRP